jgi:hypothetical protein
MKRSGIATGVCLSTAALLWAATAGALDPGPKCQAGKNKEAGKYAACRQNAATSLLKTGDGAKNSDALAKCDEKLAGKWAKLETQASAGVCPDGHADPNTLADFITECMDCVASVLSGGGPCSCSSCPAGGVILGGVCWYLGAVGNDCDTTCANAGLVYDTATLSYAGSGGTWEQCMAVLDALGQTSPPLTGFGDTACQYAWGCCVDGEFSERFRCTSPATTSTALNGHFQRACACK